MAFGVLSSVTVLVDSYLTGRRLWYGTDNGTKEYILVGYANDITVNVVAKHLTHVELYSSGAIAGIKKWLKDAGLALVENKTKVMFITKRLKKLQLVFRMGKHTIM